MFTKNFFPKGTPKEEMEKSIRQDGFNPLIINNEPGFIYAAHQHPETKLLVCLEGDMRVTVAGEENNFQPGDKLIVPGNTRHSAIVGPKGCTFYWSEKII
jgi:quercetin dioxygenase-like cupin family protein